MEILLTNFLIPTTHFSPRQPGQFVLNWLSSGANGHNNHEEPLNAKPPPIVVW